METEAVRVENSLQKGTEKGGTKKQGRLRDSEKVVERSWPMSWSGSSEWSAWDMRLKLNGSQVPQNIVAAERGF
jgi:hypothetical protein